MKGRLLTGLIVVTACALAWVVLSWYQTPGYKGKSVRGWIKLASNGDSQAIENLKELGTNAMPEFISQLKKQDSFFKKTAWNLKKKLNPSFSRALLKKAEPPISWGERVAAARALSHLGTNAAWSLPYLAEGLHDRVNEVCYNCANAMGHMGSSAVPYLVDALGDYDPNRRRAIVNALAQIGPDAEAAVPALVKMLSDVDEPVRSHSAYALQIIGAPWLKRLNQTLAEGPSDARIAAAKELLLIYPPPISLVKSLLAMAHDPSSAARKQAIETLGILRPPHSQTIPTLTQALEDASPEVRAAAARALGFMGERALPATTELTSASKDGDTAVRAAANEALDRISRAKSNQSPSERSNPQTPGPLH